MSSTVFNKNKFIVYKYLVTNQYIAFEYGHAAKIRQALIKNANVFHQIPETEKAVGQVLEENAKGLLVLSDNFEVVKIRDLDHLPFGARVMMFIRRLIGK
jgi:hypothetical protein